MNIRYGKKVETTSLDDNGSIKQVISTFRDGVPFSQIRYEVRVRVKDQTEELAEYYRFRQEKRKNSEFKVENKRNTDTDYYIVKCWEE